MGLFKETHQDSGWRKVYRIAQANGAFYDSINSMRVSIGQWKMKALAKLSKDPKAITELDKLIYQIYDVDTGELYCEIAAADSDATTIKLEHKRVKIEVQPDEIPRIGIGKKEVGYVLTVENTTNTSSNTLCTSMKPKSLGNVINVTMLMLYKKDCKNMYAIAIQKKAT